MAASHCQGASPAAKTTDLARTKLGHYETFKSARLIQPQKSDSCGILHLGQEGSNLAHSIYRSLVPQTPNFEHQCASRRLQRFCVIWQIPLRVIVEVPCRLVASPVIVTAPDYTQMSSERSRPRSGHCNLRCTLRLRQTTPDSVVLRGIARRFGLQIQQESPRDLPASNLPSQWQRTCDFP